MNRTAQTRNEDWLHWQLRQAEAFNTLTHGMATVLALAGTFILLLASSEHPLAFRVACLLYGVTLVGVFFSSTMSHWVSEEPGRSRFRRLDQGFIFLLIVATYTPFSMTWLTESRWWVILATMWGIAIAGFASKVFFSHRIHRISVIPYVLLGWLPVFGGWPSEDSRVPTEALAGVLVGGATYTLGIWFLLHDRKRWYFHSIWHLAVIAAAMIHFLTTIHWVIGAGPVTLASLPPGP